MSSTPRTEFEDQGFLGPVSVFQPEECGRIRRLLEGAPPPLDWFKGNAASSQAYHSIGSHPAIVDRVAELLGDDVMLWGASLVRKGPGETHPWHTDIETSADRAGTVTVWIGLENTNRLSSLQMISCSHRFGVTIQERRMRAGKSREDQAIEDLLSWSREIDPRSDLAQLDMGDGDAILFDGRLWHGSDNTNMEGTRTALLLQYAAPDRPMRIPDFHRLDYPFRFLEEPRPPCVMVRGSARGVDNRIVPGPTPRGHATSMSWVKALDRPLAEDERTGWKFYGIHEGPTRCMTALSCHVSVLSPGETPHEPHRHPAEELLVILDGEAELVIVGENGDRRTETIRPGSFVFYPAGQSHTIHNGSATPITYLMFKWRNDAAANESDPLPTGIFRYDEPRTEADLVEPKGWRTVPVFDGATRYLQKLHCHHSTLAPGGGYEPHVDAYDVAVLLLRGTVETLGRRVSSPGVLFYSAGEPHGVRNVGDSPASYLVFEFHGRQSPSAPRLRHRLAALVPRRVHKLVPGPVRRFARKILR